MPRPRRTPSQDHAARLALAGSLAAALMLCACGGPPKPEMRTPPVTDDAARPAPPSPAPWRPGDSDTPLRPPPDRRDELSAFAADLQAMLDRLPPSPPTPPAHATANRPDLGALSGVDPRAFDPAHEPFTPDPEPPIVAAHPTPPAPPPRELTAQELFGQIAALLARAEERDGTQASSSPLRRAVRLAALEAVEPGVATDELDRLEAELLPGEAAVFKPLRELFVRLGAGAAPEDPAAIAALLGQYSQRLAQARPLTIPTALLCERVESFGRYTPLRGATFAAGRPHEAILYVEVEHFMQRTAGAADARPGAPADAGEQWISELGQSLELLHDADGSLQWRQAEQVIRDTSRRRRTDYYLVQRITLPATLSVGKYNLKITVTDKISGATAQARIPLQIVADPNLAKTR